jgi:tetratricopeptide (TPR) repeat protein
VRTGATAGSAEKASLEKAIDIKRRAQRCLQGGDLAGAVNEYEKLTRAEDSEPINFVLLADLLFKRGDSTEAVRRYLQAVDAYAAAGLYKNAIAVCKKMTRLSLASGVILQRLAELHALDGLTTEATLYYQELAEFQAHERRFHEAATSARRAFETSPENVRLLELAGGWLEQAGEATAAAATWMEASSLYARRGMSEDAAQAEARAEAIAPGAAEVHAAAAAAEPQVATAVAEPAEAEPAAAAPTVAEPAETRARRELPAVEEPPAMPLVEGLEERRVFTAPQAVAEPAREGAAPGDPGAPAPDDGDTTPPAPAGLSFGAEARPAERKGDLEAIEELLQLAAGRLRKGDREAAGEALVGAARAYEAIDRLDSAASIYRNLGRSTQATPEILGLWLRNCEVRRDAVEAAEVACALGDRALNDGDHPGAREWFTRALRHVPDCKLALRRMERLGAESAPAGATPAGTAAASTEADGRVEVAVGRAQAVTLDLGSLLAEFQRGIESQLSGDPQSHYDLGMTYREMGLGDQAVESFRVAARDPAFAERAAEMIGRILLDQGRFDEAAEEFGRALETLPGAEEDGVGLRFHLGLAHEVAGRTARALAEFERVYAIQPNYPDVAQKIRVLRRTLESV